MDANLLTNRQLVLASASPRRLMLLRQVGVEPEQHPVEVKEISELSELTPELLVRENARRKARQAYRELGKSDKLILGADTVVVLDDCLFGKPVNREEAASMLAALSGRTHTVFTGQCLIDAATGREVCGFRSTGVRFCPLSRVQIEAYLATGEPLDKAGAYGMQGLGCLFIDGIEGDYTTVVGLSMPLLYAMTRQI